MKKTHIIYLFFALALSSCGNGQVTEGKTDSTAVAAQSASPAPARTHTFAPTDTPIDICALTNDEDSLDFKKGTTKKNQYMYTLTELKHGIDFFSANFKYNETEDNNLAVPLRNEVVNISVQNLATMIDIVKNKTTYTPRTHFSALKVYYGLENKQMVFICEPIALKKNGSGKLCGSEGSGIFYLADNSGQLTPLTDLVKKDTMIANYEKFVWINHYNQLGKITADHRFRQGNDYVLDDTKFCILPFQQIIRMYRENLGDTCTVGKSSDLVSFSIIANNYFKYSWWLGLNPKIKNYKVHILAYFNIKDNVFDYGFQGLGADFGQMCPPNCGGLVQIPRYFTRKKK